LGSMNITSVEQWRVESVVEVSVCVCVICCVVYRHTGSQDRERAPVTRGSLNAPLAHGPGVAVLLITSGVSTLLIPLGHAHLQEPSQWQRGSSHLLSNTQCTF